MRKQDMTELKSIDFNNLPLPTILQKLEAINPELAHKVLDQAEIYQRNRDSQRRYVEEQSVGHQLRKCFAKVADFVCEKLHIEPAKNGNSRGNEDRFSFDQSVMPADIRRAICDVMIDNYFSQIALLTQQERNSLKISPKIS